MSDKTKLTLKACFAAAIGGAIDTLVQSLTDTDHFDWKRLAICTATGALIAVGNYLKTPHEVKKDE